ncbi:DUF6249 domain-containing protein [Marivirga sp.]|uniref:DUF6249 domain-containing protein n=1 Tax=Marivirga sp. TaxID=2018662 RepID=UPI0025DDF960|nr:DUF6249 domain-containing protein [Marivirga sp.]
METVITFIALFAMIFGISYYSLYTRNKERLALIDAGANASIFQINQNKGKTHPIYSIALVIGMLGMGIGLGIIFAFLIEHSLDWGPANRYNNRNEEFLYISGIFIFGGLGLVGSFLTLRWLDKKDEEK